MSNKKEKKPEEAKQIPLTDMFEDYFIRYGSYVICDRAIPNIDDGLKPVQRRILHATREIDDGKFNKVANITGQSMRYHPHGDAAINDAIVHIGQKNILLDLQGNWGNIITGDGAAAGRYIEARLSKFAKEVVFNEKLTEWSVSYDGRFREPKALPVKFPLVLFTGAEGIAVGLSTKILPHNFNAICDAAIANLKGEEFKLYPDFPTGGTADVRDYNDGMSGGRVRVRAKIEAIDDRRLRISEIPFETTTTSLIESILSANDKGKIKIKNIEDNTAGSVDITINLAPGESAQKTIDALYAFTKCENTIYPTCCVIDNHRPVFLSVSELLTRSVERTKDLLMKELEIAAQELEAKIKNLSLEKLFIAEKMYQHLEKASSYEDAVRIVMQKITLVWWFVLDEGL
jgi:topoisomerase-4 subunit A